VPFWERRAGDERADGRPKSSQLHAIQGMQFRELKHFDGCVCTDTDSPLFLSGTFTYHWVATVIQGYNTSSTI